jgi:polar amino acid transport system substrate-binding protein
MKKLRVLFVFIVVAAVLFLALTNRTAATTAEQYDQKLGTILFIFALSLVIVAYVVYEVYRVMRLETLERMELIEMSRNDLQTTYNSLSMLLAVINREGIVDNVNDAVCDYLGMRHTAMIGKAFREVFLFGRDEAAQDVARQVIESCFAKGVSVSMEIKSEGKVFEASAFPMRDVAGRPRRILLMLNDVTEARTIYHQMVQDNKMAAVGQLAAGVAHEIRNPLGLIRNYCFLLHKAEGDAALKEKALSSMEFAVERAGMIIDNLLRFSRMSGDRFSDVNLAHSLKTVLGLEEVELSRRKIRVEIVCDVDIWIHVIPESFEMILINLLNNAMDAIGDVDGRITICCEQVGEKVSISVTDTGPGIPEKILPDIFNPFFTTKENHKGSGLGLYIVYNEVHKLGGSIRAEGAETGACFTVLLPAPNQEGGHHAG